MRRFHVFVLVFAVMVFAVEAKQSAFAAGNSVVSQSCEEVEVQIKNFADVETFFDALPESSEQLGDSAVYRSVSFSSSHDRFTLSCALSSEERGACVLKYQRYSATTDLCDHQPSYFPMTDALSSQLVTSLKFRRVRGGDYRLKTQDSLVSLSYSGEISSFPRVVLQLK